MWAVSVDQVRCQELAMRVLDSAHVALAGKGGLVIAALMDMEVYQQAAHHADAGQQLLMRLVIL